MSKTGGASKAVPDKVASAPSRSGLRGPCTRLLARCGAGWSRLGHGHRLALLVVASVAPLLLLLAADAVQQHRRELAAVRARVADLSRQGAEQADDAMQEASNLLRVLVRVPDVAGLDLERCHPLLKEIVSEHPRVGSISAIAPDGTVVCNSSLGSVGIRADDRPWFQEAMRPDAPRIIFSEVLFSRTTRRPAVVAAAPLPWPAADAQRPGVVAASMDVDWFIQLGNRLSGSRDFAVQIIDARQGRLVARHPALQGEDPPPADHPLFAAVRAQPGGGTAELAGFDGIERIYGFAPLPSGPNSAAYLLVGISRDAALHDARTGVATSLAFAVEATAAALLLAWLVARACVTRPLQILTDAATRLAGGDLNTRVGPKVGGGPEFTTLAATLDAMAAELQARERAVAEANRKLRVAARQDALTGLPNRRAFDELMGREWRRARRVGAPLSVLLLDVDHFKGFNDRYGHPAGDSCLRAVAGALRDALLRPGDSAARYGGEEFVVLLPGTSLAGAVHIAGQVLDAVRALGTAHEGSPFGQVTASVGVASALPGQDSPGPAALIEAADGALYAAKRGGRNQVLPHQEPGFDPAAIPGLLPAAEAA